MKSGGKMNVSESRFYAFAENSSLSPGQQLEGKIILGKKVYSASLKSTSALSPRLSQPYLLVRASLPEALAWNDCLNFKPNRGGKTIELRVICPEAEQVKKQKEDKLVAWLDRLTGSEEDLVMALTDAAGIKGLKEEDISTFCRLQPPQLLQLAMGLEKKGQIYILSFSPLFILSQRSFSFLVKKIYNYIESYHLKRPQEQGVPLKKIQDHFSLPRQILLLALKRLAKDSQVILTKDLATLSSFETKVSAEEAEVMKAVEHLLHQEKFSVASFDEMAQKFKIHSSRLNTLLDLLLRQKKIVKSQEGFWVHSDWLNSLKAQLDELKASGRRELTIGEFKKLTGLSRKYAIPLLEFLDELGLTRRIGNKRLIL